MPPTGQGDAEFIEIGPHSVLTAMGQEIASNPKNDPETAEKWLKAGWSASLKKNKEDCEVILESVGTLYTSGVEIDWKAYDQGYMRKKVALPTYPFQRKRYWVEGVKNREQHRNQEHPLLGYRIESASHVDEISFSSEFSIENFPYLVDHVVYGNVIVPGAAYLEMALAVSESLLKKNPKDGERAQVQSLLIEKPMLLEEGKSRDAQFILSRKEDSEGSYSFKVLSWAKQIDGSPQDTWVGHASGEIHLGDSPDAINPR